MLACWPKFEFPISTFGNLNLGMLANNYIANIDIWKRTRPNIGVWKFKFPNIDICQFKVWHAGQI